MKLNISDFTAKIVCDKAVVDTKIETEARENELDIYISATKDRPKFIELHWNVQLPEDALVLGDVWERSYGNLEFLRLCENDRDMAWYFIATDKKKSLCFGVKTGCNSFVSFRCEGNGITALVDVRNGGNGVHLDGRRILAATFVNAAYDDGNVFDNLKDFCRKMCSNPLLPEERIYGGNNWYYAYGKSSYKQIVSDAVLQSELSKGIENRPFQVVDDCWQKKRCSGPWYPNRKFKDMKKLAYEIKSLGVRPGIWVRLLRNKDRKIPKEQRILRGGKRVYLDPTHPGARAQIKADVERIRDWGFELLKHDFSGFDLFGEFPRNYEKTITQFDDWHFYDKTKTNAEICLDFYRLVKEASGDMLIIGCDTVSHLSAGLVHIYRIGDDTSGREWQRTKEMGVNTLAFRLAQNEAFYMCDADCVGILKDNIPWEKNGQWLHILSYSNTPLFISCTDKINEVQKKDISQAYRIFNEPHEIKPVDIFDTRTPCEWEIDGKTVKYDW